MKLSNGVLLQGSTDVETLKGYMVSCSKYDKLDDLRAKVRALSDEQLLTQLSSLDYLMSIMCSSAKAAHFLATVPDRQGRMINDVTVEIIKGLRAAVYNSGTFATDKWDNLKDIFGALSSPLHIDTFLDSTLGLADMADHMRTSLDEADRLANVFYKIWNDDLQQLSDNMCGYCPTWQPMENKLLTDVEAAKVLLTNGYFPKIAPTQECLLKMTKLIKAFGVSLDTDTDTHRHRDR